MQVCVVSNLGQHSEFLCSTTTELMKGIRRIVIGTLNILATTIIFCSSLGHAEKDYCHVFDFMLGILFYNIPFEKDEETTSRLSDLALLDLAFRYPDYEALNQAAYNSSYAGSNYGFYTDPEWRQGMFRFCESSINPNLSCSLLFFNTYDELSTISTDYYYPVDKGACNDSFTISDWFASSRLLSHSLLCG